MKIREFVSYLIFASVLFFLLVTENFASKFKNEDELKNILRKEFYSIIDTLYFPIGFAFLDLSDGDSLLFNEDEIFPTASAIKIEILIHLLREYEQKNLNLYDKIPINKKVGGSGILQYFDQQELYLSYFNLALLMIQQSDNTATNLLIEKLTMPKINQTINELGLKNTKLQRVMMDFEARKAGKENISTPKDKLDLLKLIHEGKTISDSLRKISIKILSIPKETPLTILLNDEKISIASKGGQLNDVRCEMGIFYHPSFNYILVIMTKDLKNSKDGDEVIKKLSLLFYDYMIKKYLKGIN